MLTGNTFKKKKIGGCATRAVKHFRLYHPPRPHYYLVTIFVHIIIELVCQFPRAFPRLFPSLTKIHCLHILFIIIVDIVIFIILSSTFLSSLPSTSSPPHCTNPAHPTLTARVVSFSAYSMKKNYRTYPTWTTLLLVITGTPLPLSGTPPPPHTWI